VSGGSLAGRLRKRFPDRFSGPPTPADAVVFYRDPGEDRTDAVKQFEQGLIEGLNTGRPVVAVERLDTDPSQIPFYTAQRITSVDNVDSAGGRIALVLALAGPFSGRGGSFGYKKTADAPLPELPQAGAGG
jgi:hypothetical protein